METIVIKTKSEFGDSTPEPSPDAPLRQAQDDEESVQFSSGSQTQSQSHSFNKISFPSSNSDLRPSDVQSPSFSSIPLPTPAVDFIFPGRANDPYELKKKSKAKFTDEKLQFRVRFPS
jgi:hypothetical protein